VAETVVMVCGSRSWRDYETIHMRLAQWMPSLVMHGGARGADELAQRACEALGIPTHVLYPLWLKHGRHAGLRRTDALLDGEPDQVLAFWDGSSPGTRYTIREANRRGIPVDIFYERQEPLPLDLGG
jgi:YspA, cpYpsA-related SLOG family